MADYYAATFARAAAASDAVDALERAGVDRFRMSYAVPAVLRPGEREGALEGLRHLFHPDVGLTGGLIHMGFPEEAARALTTAVEEGETLLVIVPDEQGRAVQQTLERLGARRIMMVDAAGATDVAITRPRGPLGPKMDLPQEYTHNPEAAHAYTTLEGETLGETTDHLGDRG